MRILFSNSEMKQALLALLAQQIVVRGDQTVDLDIVFDETDGYQAEITIGTATGAAAPAAEPVLAPAPVEAPKAASKPRASRAVAAKPILVANDPMTQLIQDATVAGVADGSKEIGINTPEPTPEPVEEEGVEDDQPPASQEEETPFALSSGENREDPANPETVDEPTQTEEAEPAPVAGANSLFPSAKSSAPPAAETSAVPAGKSLFANLTKPKHDPE